MNFASVILTGGKSSRMGSDKALLKIGNHTFVEEIYDKLREVFQTVILSVSKKGKYGDLNMDVLEVEDIYKDIGPIGGLYSVFKQTEFDGVFVVGVDTPFISTKAMLKILELGIGYDICMVEKKDGKLEPLFAYYGKSCLPHIESLIASNSHKMSELCKVSRIRLLSQDKLEELTGESLDHSLVNLNTRTEYERYLKP